MVPTIPLALVDRSPSPPAEPAQALARPFDSWTPDAAILEQDPVDRVLGRAAFDPGFCRELLANPWAALAAEPMDFALKRRLIAIREPSLAAFARRAVAARDGLPNTGPTVAAGAGSLDPARLAGAAY